MNVYIGGTKDYSAMRGPAPEGFHVPTKDEWNNIYTAYTGLGLSGGTNFSTYLKLPLAGMRLHNNLNYSNRGVSGSYWTVDSAASNTAKYVLFDTSNVFIDNNTYRSYGMSIRSFKNTPIIPDNNWTTLYAGTGDAGIFHDTTNGLISISSNGTTWYTIADKNLGATAVYNSGDTLSESNCGKVYQRGNNYGFSGDANYDTSQITQSSTKVDVTGYGPGNYYSSSTWITVNPRQSSANDGYNLRGGATGIVSPAELKNAYIGDGWWKLSTDFTQYTSLAQIQAQGWTGTTYSTSTSPTFSYGSNGIGVYSSSGSKHGGIYVKLPNKITAQNKVVMKYTGTVSQIDGGIYMTLSTYNRPDLQASTQADFSYSQSYRSSASGQGLGISKNVNGTKSWGFWQDGRTIQGTAGTYEVEVRLDMPNSKAKWICTSPSGMAYTSEATISSDGMASIIGMEYFIIWGVCYSSGVTDYIKSGEIAVI